MIQSSLFQFVKDDTPLDPNIILLNNTQWENCLDELKQAQYCGLDIETYGSQPEHGLNPWKGEIRLIQIGLPSGRTLICDLQNKGFDSPRKRFFEILRDRLRNIICIGTSLKFDALWLRVKYGMIIYRPRCIQLMSKVLWAGIRFMKHSLKEIAERCGIEIDKTEQTWDWGGKLTNKQLNYAHFDAHVPIKCCAKLVEWLREAGCLTSAMIECEAMPAFCETEYFGQPVDYAKLQATREAYRIAWNDSIKPFQAAFPGINPNSPKQVASALAAKYGKDFDSTSDDVLSKYQDPALTALLENRSLKTQVDRLDELHTRYFDGSVRGKVQQIAGEEDEAGAGMGRSAYKEPNWQNIGKLQPNWKKLGLPPTRAVVRAPKGYVYICADLSQAHARIACQVSKDPFLIKAYADDYDVHSDMAFELAKKRNLDWNAKQIKQWSKDKNHPNHSEAKTLRDAAKNCFYGSLNLQAPSTLVRTCSGSAEPIFITEDEAKYLIQLWRQKYAGLYSFQRLRITEAGNKSILPVSYKGSVEYGSITGPTGRRLFLAKLPNKYQKGEKTIKGTDCVSFIWMGAEADIIKHAMAEIFYLRDPKWELNFRNMAHDELNLTALEEYAEPASKLVFDCIHKAMKRVISIIPVDEANASPAGLIIEDWSKK